VPPVGKYLMRRIADARTMRVAIDSLTRHGAKAPGPSQTRLEELSDSERWSLARALAACVADGTYRLGPSRKVPIPKEGRPGEFRVLTIQSAEDRVVGKAAQLVLAPLIEPMFSPFSFGFRKQVGRFEALATMLALARRQNKWFAVCTDVEKAFDKIPHSRLIDACRHHVPEDVANFIGLISHTGKKRGIPQGAPHSPLCANVFFDRFLDRPEQRSHPRRPLNRYADNLLLLCESAGEAEEALEELSELARAAGTPLKAAASSISDLRGGESLEWLGFILRREGDSIALRIGETAWQRLEWRFAKAHHADNAWLRARQIAQGWIDQMAACFKFEDREGVLRRIRHMAERFAFDEIPARSELLQRWGAAHARWHRLYTKQEKLLSHRLWLIQSATSGSSSCGSGDRSLAGMG
jgi:hypothetical protein